MKPDAEVLGYPKSGINEAPDDRRREGILARLSAHFPTGASPKREALYIADLRKYRFAIKDVREGVERVIATRETTTFPPLALVAKHCREAQADRLKAERAGGNSGGGFSEERPQPFTQIYGSTENALAEFRRLRDQAAQVRSNRENDVRPSPRVGRGSDLSLDDFLGPAEDSYIAGLSRDEVPF